MARATPETVCVILAAGLSKRYGRNKLLEPFESGTLLERAIGACAGFETVVVCSPETARAIEGAAVRIVVNERAELGMSQSLICANAVIDAQASIAVLPADLAFIEASSLQDFIARAGESDVTYPVSRDGTPGHPVIFSADARTRIPALARGDSIRALRDDPELTRQRVAIAEPWPFVDVDVPRSGGIE